MHDDLLNLNILTEFRGKSKNQEKQIQVFIPHVKIKINVNMYMSLSIDKHVICTVPYYNTSELNNSVLHLYTNFVNYTHLT